MSGETLALCCAMLNSHGIQEKVVSDDAEQGICSPAVSRRIDESEDATLLRLDDIQRCLTAKFFIRNPT